MAALTLSAWLLVSTLAAPPVGAPLPELPKDARVVAPRAVLHGSPAIVHLGAAFCAGCEKEPPKTRALAARVRRVLISLDPDEAGARKLAGDSADMTVILGGSGSVKAWVDKHFPDVSLPTALLLDAQGNVRWVKRDALTDADVAALSAAIDGLSAPVKAATALPPLPSTLQTVSGPMPSFQGSFAVLHVTATWCSPCLKDGSILQKLALENPGVKVIAVSADNAATDAIKSKLTKSYGALPVLIDPKGITDSPLAKWCEDALGKDMVLPTTVLLDREGRVLATQKGAMALKPGDADAFLATVKSAVAAAK